MGHFHYFRLVVLIHIYVSNLKQGLCSTLHNLNSPLPYRHGHLHFECSKNDTTTCVYGDNSNLQPNPPHLAGERPLNVFEPARLLENYSTIRKILKDICNRCGLCQCLLVIQV